MSGWVWLKRKPLTRRQIIEKIREINEGKDSKMGFCQNSRRWMITMSMSGIPKSCPYEQEQGTHCGRCGYYERKEPTSHLIQKLQYYRWGTEDD